MLQETIIRDKSPGPKGYATKGKPDAAAKEQMKTMKLNRHMRRAVNKMMDKQRKVSK